MFVRFFARVLDSRVSDDYYAAAVMLAFWNLHDDWIEYDIAGSAYNHCRTTWKECKSENWTQFWACVVCTMCRIGCDIRNRQATWRKFIIDATLNKWSLGVAPRVEYIQRGYIGRCCVTKRNYILNMCLVNHKNQCKQPKGHITRFATTHVITIMVVFVSESHISTGSSAYCASQRHLLRAGYTT